MKIYIAIELRKDNVPRVIGAYKNKSDAENAAYNANIEWGNVIESEVK